MDDGNYGPMLLMADNRSQEEIAVLEAQIKQKEEELAVSSKEVDNLKTYISSIKPSTSRGLVGHYPFDRSSSSKVSGYNVYQGDNKPKPDDKIIFDGNQKAYSNGNPPLATGKIGKGY